eukprot:gene3156-biopygen18685
MFEFRSSHHFFGSWCIRRGFGSWDSQPKPPSYPRGRIHRVGLSLIEQHAKQGGLPEVIVRRYTRQFVRGVDYLHGQDPPVMHRDIKPANILVDASGVCKVADFGASKHLASSHTQAAQTAVTGTPLYDGTSPNTGRTEHARAMPATRPLHPTPKMTYSPRHARAMPARVASFCCHDAVCLSFRITSSASVDVVLFFLWG